MTEIKFKVTNTNHITVKAKINGFKGLFIVDTGASNTCISKEAVNAFKMVCEESNNSASGAGSKIQTQISYNNNFEICDLEIFDLDCIIIDMNHINETLINAYECPIHGIIGADILIHFNATISYSESIIYLFR